MSKARIRWIAGISLGCVAVLAGGGYFVQLWRSASAKAAETIVSGDATTAEQDKTVKPIPVEPEEDEPTADFSGFEKPRATHSAGSPARLTALNESDLSPAGGDDNEFATPAANAPKDESESGPGFDEQPGAPPTFGARPENAASGGGGFDTGKEEPEPEVPNRLSDEPPARFADTANDSTQPSAQPSARRPASKLHTELAQADVSLDDELSPPRPASRSAFDDQGSRGPAAGGGLAAAKIDGPHSDGLGAPGPRQLEGLQSPSLALEKSAPNEIQIGKPATFQIKVRNVGQVEAHEVVVQDDVPKGTKFVDATPPAGRTPEGALAWQLGTIRPGEEQTISLQLMPTAEGEIGSVARVSFQAQASIRTISTRPQLKVEHTAPPKVLIGQGVTLSIKISNPGTGAATNVVLEEDVPEGLSHPAGNELEFEVGTLRPGESKSLDLVLKAEKAGQITNVLLVRGDAGLSAEDSVPIEVIAPQLEVDMKGPSRRFLDRQATYVLSVANNGTAPAREVELVAFLPKGFKFVETNNAGQYDAQKHAVFWSLAELPQSESGAVQLITVPVEAGEQKLRVEARADLGLADSREQAVVVEGVAQLMFDVIDAADPIEVGSDTLYQVRIVNQGTKAATNVRVAALLPAELQPVEGTGPSRGAVEGQKVLFEPLARLAPKGEVTYKIQVRGVKAGDPRIRVQVSSDEIQTPVTKEESTKVYSDQ